MLVEKARRMRTKGTTRGNGPQAGVCVPTPSRRDRSFETRGYGPRLRGRHAGRNKSAVSASHESHSHVVFPRNGRARYDTPLDRNSM